MLKQVLFLSLLLLTPPIEARRSTGSGGFRGSSASRQNVPSGGGGFHPQSNQGFHPQSNSNFNPQPNSGFRPNQGGFHPQPNQGFGGQPGGFNRGGFAGGPSHFVPGSGVGSAKSGSAFKSALAGAAIGTIGGLVVFEAGKAILSSASSPFHYNNRDYYFGQEYHKQRPGEISCSMPWNNVVQTLPTETTTAAPVTAAPDGVTTTPSPTQTLTNLQFSNGTRPKEIVWSCKQGSEVCCGTDCCPAPVQQNPNGSSSQGGSGSNIFGIVLGVLLVIALLACCCCFAIYKLCRNSLESCLPSSSQRDEQHYYEDGTAKYEGPAYGQSYPMQPYSNQPYSNQPYPPQPQQYPPQQQGYYPQQKY